MSLADKTENQDLANLLFSSVLDGYSGIHGNAGNGGMAPRGRYGTIAINYCIYLQFIFVDSRFPAFWREVMGIFARQVAGGNHRDEPGMSGRKGNFQAAGNISRYDIQVIFEPL